MTRYLPDSGLQPAGSEIAELIDVPPMHESANSANAVERPEGTTRMRLDTQTRLNIASWAEEYIAGVVDNHDGDREDVRSIIQELYVQRAIGHHDGSGAWGDRGPDW